MFHQVIHNEDLNKRYVNLKEDIFANICYLILNHPTEKNDNCYTLNFKKPLEIFFKNREYKGLWLVCRKKSESNLSERISHNYIVELVLEKYKSQLNIEGLSLDENLKILNCILS
jgi:hypothetical protein